MGHQSKKSNCGDYFTDRDQGEGSSCQNTGRRGREKVNRSYPTAYTPEVIGAWKANCFVCVRMLLMFTNKL